MSLTISAETLSLIMFAINAGMNLIQVLQSAKEIAGMDEETLNAFIAAAEGRLKTEMDKINNR